MENGSNNKAIKDLIDQIKKEEASIFCSGFTGSDQAYLVSEINSRLKVPVIVVTDAPQEAEKFITDLKFFAPSRESDILYFPI